MLKFYSEVFDGFKLWVSRNWVVLRFSLLFVFFMFVFYVFYLWSPRSWFNRQTASELGFVLDLLGYGVRVEGDLVFVNGSPLRVIDECTSVYSLIVFAACVLAYPVGLREKIVGLAGGVPFIYGVNLIRLVSLSFVVVEFPSLFEVIHLYVWQVTLIILIVLALVFWFDFIVEKRR